MSMVILIGCMLIIAVALFASFQSAAGIRRNLVMSVTLPDSYLKHPEVEAVVKEYRKLNRSFFLAAVIAILPILLVGYVSLQMIYLGVWMAVDFIVNNMLYCKYNNRLILLKSRNRWFMKEYEYRILERKNAGLNRSAFLSKWFPDPLDQLLSQSEEPVYVDEDEHWINGYYYNPEDKKTMVDKRVGAGLTVNVATRSGKLNYYGSIVFVTVLMLSLFLLIAAMDFATFRMVIGDTRVEVKAPLYGCEFNLSDIRSVELVDSLPGNGIRTNGASTKDYYLGNFKLEGYGSSKVYVYREYPPFLVVTLPDRTVIFNSRSMEKTKALYDRLKEAVPSEIAP